MAKARRPTNHCFIACAGWQDHLLSSLSRHPVATPSPFMHVMRWWYMALPLLTLTLLATLVVLPALHLEPVPRPPAFPMQPAPLQAAGLCDSTSMSSTPECGGPLHGIGGCGAGNNTCMAGCGLDPPARTADGAVEQSAAWGSGVLRRWSDAGRQALQSAGLAAARLGGLDRSAGARDDTADVKPDSKPRDTTKEEHGCGSGSMEAHEVVDAAATEHRAPLQRQLCRGDRDGGGGGQVVQDVVPRAASERLVRTQTGWRNGTARAEVEQRLLELLALVRKQRVDAPAAGDWDAAGESRSLLASGGNTAAGSAGGS